MTKVIRSRGATWGRKCITLISVSVFTVFERGISAFANFGPEMRIGQLPISPSISERPGEILHDLPDVPTIVIAHTFCASPDTRISYRQCLVIQGYSCAV